MTTFVGLNIETSPGVGRREEARHAAVQNWMSEPRSGKDAGDNNKIRTSSVPYGWQLTKASMIRILIGAPIPKTGPRDPGCRVHLWRMACASQPKAAAAIAATGGASSEPFSLLAADAAVLVEGLGG